MKIAMGSDHGGFALKQHLKTYLENKGCLVEDCGTDSTQSCDYPDFGRLAAEAVAAFEGGRHQRRVDKVMSIEG